MLKDLGIYDKVIGGKKCKKCWAVPQKIWFTARHHRETPYRIENNQADAFLAYLVTNKAQKIYQSYVGVSFS